MKHIVIAGDFWFPTGTASAARIRNLAEGLQAGGHQVQVISMSPTRLSQKMGVLPSGVGYENTAVFNLPNTRLRSLIWFAGLYGSVVPTYQRLHSLISQKKCDLFIAYGRNAALLMPLVQLCHHHNIPCILDIVEILNQFSGQGGRLNPVYWDWYWGIEKMPLYFDGLTVISKGLQKKYLQKGCPNVLLLPSIEEWESLPIATQPNRQSLFSLLWVSALVPRDNPELLLQAMVLLYQQGIPVQLNIVGRFYNNVHGKKIAQKCQEDPVLQKCVHLVGEVTDSELHTHMGLADGLVLLRRDDATERYSFPTRLVEYLKQKRPIFVSDVGDIRDYLQNGRDAILVSPDDPAQIAQAIAQIVQAPERGRAIGEQGYRQGLQCFNRDKHAKALLTFAETLTRHDKRNESHKHAAIK